MRQSRLAMGMPATLEIVDGTRTLELFDEFFAYFERLNEKFSTYKENSEMSKINKGQIKNEEQSDEMKLIFKLSEETKKITGGYFDIVGRNGKYDPSGIVKGWAIMNAANILKRRGVKNFCIDVGGDIQVGGNNNSSNAWRIGIENPFRTGSANKESVKTIYLEKDEGVATSGNYLRGQHIYNPKNKTETIDDIISLTVIGLNTYEADRFATAAFAMGKDGINFIESLVGFEGYMIDKNGIATMTRGFNKYA